MRTWMLLVGLLAWGCDDGSRGPPADGAVVGDAAVVDAARDAAEEPPPDAAITATDRGLGADASAPDAAPLSDLGEADAAIDPDDGVTPDQGVDAGVAPDMTAPDMTVAPPAQPTPRITELLARNPGPLEDEDGATSDWLELHNPGDAPYDLAEHHLTDDLDEPRKWQFGQTTIPPKGYLVVFASSKDRNAPEGVLHTNFKLAGDGESIALTNPDGVVLDVIVDYPGQVEGVAYGFAMRQGRAAIVDTGAAARLWVGADPAGAEQLDFDDSGWTPILQGAGIDERAADDAAGAELIETNLRPFIGPASAFWLRVPFELAQGGADLEVELAFDDGIAVWLDGVELHRENDTVGAATDRPASRAAGRVRIALAEREAGPGMLVLRVVNAAADDGLFFGHVALNRLGLIIEDRARYLPEPTPGAPNLGRLGGLAPLVVDLDRDQAIGPGDPLGISTQVLPTDVPVESVVLTYRVMFGPEESVEMARVEGADGEQWAVELAADLAAPGQMIRWYVTAIDEAGRAARFPPYLDPLDSEQYYGTMVDPGEITTNLPVYHWFVEDLDAANTEAGTRGAIWYGGELYDNISIDLHGQATTRFPKKSYNFDFNRDHRFGVRDDMERVKDFDLLTNYADKSKMRNTMSYGMFRESGHDYHLVFPVRVHRNGAFFAVYEFVEDPDERWLRRMGYTEPLGAIYKCYDQLVSVDGSQKKTREEDDTADLAALINGIGAQGEDLRRYLFDNIDMARMANFMAMLFITSGRDCCTKNYYAYHHLKTDQWWFLPWDIDLSLGRNWTGTYFNDDMWPRNGLYPGRNNRLTSALFAVPEFDEMYLRRIRTLIDQLMQPSATPYEDRYLENEADRLLALIGDDARLDNEAWGMWGISQSQEDAVVLMTEGWMIPRRQYLYGELVQREGGPVRVLVDGDPGATRGRWLVPVNNALGAEWAQPGFDDAAWSEGPLGLGYENGGGDYGGNIRSQVRPQDLDNQATNILLRVPFVLDDAAVDALTLRMKFEDGYVAWLNGVEVARRNVPQGPIGWQAGAAVHDDGDAVRFDDVDISAFAEALQVGENMLAIQVVNTSANSSDLLILPALIDGEPGADGPLPPRQADDVNVRIDEVEVAGMQSYIAVENLEGTAVDLT
ncbi:MAG: hypothetical protein ACI9U2_003408, partial [Bradymonadia bacterium]